MTDTENNIVGMAATLVTPDLRGTVDWYVEKLGFACTTEDIDEFGFAFVELGSVSIAFKAAGAQPVPNRTHTPKLDLFDVYVWVRDIARIEARLREYGTEIAEGPVERIYGCTEIAVHDPNGYRIVFGYCP